MDEMSLTARTTIGATLIVCKSHRGSALIAIIAAILLFSVLAATLLPLVSSSRQQTAFHHLADQAYFLAESGYRMALHQYQQAQTMGQKVAALQDMDGQRFQLEGVGSFEIRIYSYYFVLTHRVDANQYQATIAGSIPPEFLEFAFGQPQYLNIGNQTYEANISSFGDNGEITISLENEAVFDVSLPDFTIAYPIVSGTGFDPDKGFLSYENGGGDLFPETHGRIILSGRILTYNNRTDNQFEGIRDPIAPSQPLALNISSEFPSPIIMTNFSRLHSTGIIGQGGAEVRRELIYHGAFPLAPFLWEDVTEETFSETSAIADWETTDGSVTINEVDGNRALFFEESGPDGGLAAPAAAAADRFTGYRGVTGGFLSYDVQVKLGFDNSLFTETNDDDLDPDNVPSFAGGLSFRLSGAGEETPLSLMGFNGYGLSIVRGYTGFRLPGDALESGPLVVLWQQSGGIATRTWLAYSTVDPPTEGVALLARLHEAVLLPFHGGGPAAIRAGDRIYGTNSGAMGTVLSSPILSNGAWDAGSAEGTLLLNNVTRESTFQKDEPLLVIGRSNSSAKVLQEVTTDTKENIIRAYRANGVDYPRIVDNQRLQWPPDDMDQETFPFRVIQWNGMNDAIPTAARLYPDASDPAVRSIIRSHHPELLSKDWRGSATAVAELGLLALGDGATDIFFDDFGFRLIYPLREDFASPLQQ